MSKMLIVLLLVLLYLPKWLHIDFSDTPSMAISKGRAYVFMIWMFLLMHFFVVGVSVLYVLGGLA